MILDVVLLTTTNIIVHLISVVVNNFSVKKSANLLSLTTDCDNLLIERGTALWKKSTRI